MHPGRLEDPIIVSPTLMRMNARAILRVAPVRPDERWRVGERGGQLSAIAVTILAGSLVLHGAVLAFALLGARARTVAPQEIPVEVVQEPAPAPIPAPPVHDAAKFTPPKSTAQPPAAPSPPPPIRTATAPDPAEEQRAGLEHELAALKAEQASLKAEDAGLGPLRDSIGAVALPSETSTGEADVVSYQALVFSRLARAKESIVSKAVAGTVGVRFSVDEEGRLVDVAVAVSSGNATLDEEATTIVRRAAPFPKPPQGAERVFSANVASAVVTR